MYKPLIEHAESAVDCLDRMMFNAFPWDPMFAGKAANHIEKIKAKLKAMDANPPKPKLGPGTKAVADALRARFGDMPLGSKGSAEVFLDLSDVAAMLAEVEAQ